MSTSRSTKVLLAMCGVLGALVIADMAGLLPGRGGDDTQAFDDESPRALYVEAALAEKTDRALIDQESEWHAARDAAEQRWSDVRSRLIAAPTLELAESRLREMVIAALADLRLASPPRVSYVREGAPAAPSTAVVPVAIRVEFDTPSHLDAYLALDRLRHMSGAAVTLTSIVLSGPGRPQIPEQVTATISLRAPAIIGDQP